jgi:hypothetical protein
VAPGQQVIDTFHISASRRQVAASGARPS